jgi:hypothetical protein
MGTAPNHLGRKEPIPEPDEYHMNDLPRVINRTFSAYRTYTRATATGKTSPEIFGTRDISQHGFKFWIQIISAYGSYSCS